MVDYYNTKNVKNIVKNSCKSLNHRAIIINSSKQKHLGTARTKKAHASNNILLRALYVKKTTLNHLLVKVVFLYELVSCVQVKTESRFAMRILITETNEEDIGYGIKYTPKRVCRNSTALLFGVYLVD